VIFKETVLHGNEILNGFSQLKILTTGWTTTDCDAFLLWSYEKLRCH